VGDFFGGDVTVEVVRLVQPLWLGLLGMGSRRLREFESFRGQVEGKSFSEFINSFFFNALAGFFGHAELDWGDLGNLLLAEGLIGNLFLSIISTFLSLIRA
jgi:hypothetical protein